MARLTSEWSHDLEQPTLNLAQLKVDADELQPITMDLLSKTPDLFFLVTRSKDRKLSI
jgi:hypothetical protein